MKIEICVDSLESAIKAEKGGAHRIELCADLALGGTTPSYGLMKLCKDSLNIEIYTMIRPRSGDFCYSDLDFQVMIEDVLCAKKLNMDGVVLGILKKDGVIDKDRMKKLIDLARPMKITIHRAFDMTKDMEKSLEDVIDLGIDRILTSAFENKVYENLQLLKELVIKNNKRTIIMAGSGINVNNLEDIIKTGVDEIHLSASKEIDSSMVYRKYNISMGAASSNKEYKISVACEDIVSEIIKKINLKQA